MHPLEKNIHDADEFWSDAGKVHDTLRHVGAILDCEGIEYAVMGRAAQMAHGLEQYNLNTDVFIVTSDGLKAMHQRLPARGFIKLSERRFRDTTTDSEFKVVVAGEPAASDSCPVCFPDPSNTSIMCSGYRVIDLAHFVELKLASGHRESRLRDLADVLQLIQTSALPRKWSTRSIHAFAINTSASGSWRRSAIRCLTDATSGISNHFARSVLECGGASHRFELVFKAENHAAQAGS